ncbi:Sodium/hydrogen exchanger family-domain-containing protein [Lentinula detonsa]|uniref:Sodium/hydrogen exchanger family-domain-containing protein n=1 Tax=Lentinula detonsa TaxID=2804962 RepID=A0AA38Q7L1_9AGAR|nr:Sodium/hydrogen exchanger family-domain-containing protein [Lentinula detonsa]
MGEFSNLIISILKREAPDQGGLLTGKDPSAFNTSDPLRLWIIQVGVIVGMASLLSLVLRKIRQPKVIAEVLGGILLGPTAFGRIPGFTEHVFPSDSIPYLSLVANIGLCLFLFLVGLEIDMAIIRRNAKLSGTVAIAGMVIPFGAGAGLAKALYSQFINTPDSGLTGFVKFTYFMLFTGVAYSITAFPVLCRILTELKLLDTTVGVVVLSAGVANDIIGWTLLALSVALVNAGSGVTAVYILLVCVAWALLLLFPGKKALHWLGRKTGSTEGHGPSMFFMTVTMLLLFGSSFFTDVIGVHAIFGAFLTGIIVPREGNLAIYLTEKLEDMVSIIFLPLYFTLSGLSTNLGLLDNGITWGYTIAICALAFTGKFGGCCLAAHYVAKFSWRESGTIGSLMSCKGLVELIVLNVGLSAGILSQRVFSMFVLEALLLTFMTTPLVTILYPPEARVRVSATGANFNNVNDNIPEPRSKLDIEDRKVSSSDESSDGEERMKTRFTVVLDRIEHLPGMMALTQMIKPSLVSGPLSAPAPPVADLEPPTLANANEIPGGATLVSPTPVTLPTVSLPSLQLMKPINHHISALRLVELSDRTSAVMKSISMASHPDHAAVLAQCDPMLNIYTTFASLNDLSVTPALETVPYDDLARAVVDFARDAGYTGLLSGSRRTGGEMLLLPWLPPTVGQLQGVESHAVTPAPGAVVHNPFDTLFNKGSSTGMEGASTPVSGSHAIHSMGDRLSNSVAATIHSHFVRQVFSKATVDVGLFMDLGCKQAAAAAAPMGMLGGLKPSSLGGVDHILLPFFGGPDDRLALAFVAQLCENEKITATYLKITKTEEVDGENLSTVPTAHLSTDNTKNFAPPETLMTVASAFSARSAAGFPDTVYGHANTATRMQSETADHLAWARFANATEFPSSSSSTGSSSGMFPSRAALSRIRFQDLSSPLPLHGVIAEANRIRSTSTSGRTKLLIVTGRSRRLAVENHAKELKRLMEEQHAHGIGGDVRKTIGDVASSIVISGCAQEVLVVQAANIDL